MLYFTILNLKQIKTLGPYTQRGKFEVAQVQFLGTDKDDYCVLFV